MWRKKKVVEEFAEAVVQEKESTKEKEYNNIIYNIYYYNIIYIYINIYNKYNNIYNKYIYNNINIFINNNLNKFYSLSLLCEDNNFLSIISSKGYSPNEAIEAMIEYWVNDKFWEKTILFPNTLINNYMKILPNLPTKKKITLSINSIDF